MTTNLIISNTVIGPSGPLNGATIWLYAASRFNTAPKAGDPPPAGLADAGPVVSGTNFGGTGQFQIAAPNAVAYYVGSQYAGTWYWVLDESLVDTTTGGGGVASVTAQDATIVVTGTGTNPALAVGTVPYSQLTGTVPFLSKANNLSDVASVTTSRGNLKAQGPVFDVVAYGADPTGVANSSTAVTNAWAAAQAASPSILWFPPGTYKCDTGIITRTLRADAFISIKGGGVSTTTIVPNANSGNAAFIKTDITDTSYWFQGGALNDNIPPLAPVEGFTLDLVNLIGGGVGIQHGDAIGGYYDVYVLNGSGAPHITGGAMDREGVIGWKWVNGLDTNSAQRYTEETVFGPNCGAENCYIGVLFDANTGTASFGYTQFQNFRFRILQAGQRGLVVRNTGTPATGASLYNSTINIKGNLSNVNSGTTTIGTLTADPSSGTTLTIGGGISAPVGPGATLQLSNGSATVICTVADYHYYATGATSVTIQSALGAGLSAYTTLQTPSGYDRHSYVGVPTADIGGGAVTSITVGGGITQPLYDGEIIQITDCTGGSPPQWNTPTAAKINGCTQLAMVRGYNASGATTLNVYSFTPKDLRAVTYTFSTSNASPYNVVTVELVPCSVIIGNGMAATIDADASIIHGAFNYFVESGSIRPYNSAHLFINPAASVNARGSFQAAKFSSGILQNNGTLQWNGDFEVAAFETSGTQTLFPFGTIPSRLGVRSNAAIEVVPLGITTNYPTAGVNAGIYIQDTEDGSATIFHAISGGPLSIQPDGAGSNTGRVVARTTSTDFTVPIRVPANSLATGQGVTRYLGNTSGAPSGVGAFAAVVFAVGDWMTDSTAPTVWFCTSAGTGAGSTWSQTTAVTAAPTGSAGGDLTGTYPNPTLSGTANVHSVVQATSIAGDVTGTIGATTVAQIQGHAVTSGQGILVSQSTTTSTRNTSSLPATAGNGEFTILTGSTGSQTLTLNTSPQAGSINTIVNSSSVSVTVTSGATINWFGTTGDIILPANGVVQLQAFASVWYVTAYNSLTHAQGTLPIANGGTGASALTALALGSSTATTQSVGDNSTKLATTAFVQAVPSASNAGPAINGLAAWTFDPWCHSGSSAMADAGSGAPSSVGTTYLMQVYIPYTQTITGVWISVNVAAVAGTNHGMYASLIDTSGNIRAATADFFSAAVGSGAGNLATPSNSMVKAGFAATYSAAAGYYYIGLRYTNNGGSPTHAQLVRGGAQNGGILNVNTANPTALATGARALLQTALAIPVAGNTYTAGSGWTSTNALPFWAGLY